MYELRVLNGLHEGAAFPLSGERWKLGNLSENDLQLCDDAIKPEHAELTFTDNHWILTTLQGDAFSETTQSIVAPYALQEGEIFSLSGVWLIVVRGESPWDVITLPEAKNEHVEQSVPVQIASPIHRQRGRVILSVLIVCLVAVVTFFSSGKRTEKNTAITKPVITDVATLKDILSDKLRDRDLTKVVSIETDGNALNLTGAITKTQLAIVDRLMMAMNRDYLIKVPFGNLTRLKMLTLPFKIIQINAGPQGNIVTENGQRLFIGDSEEGFTLSAINAHQIQFTGSDNISVKW